MNIEKVILNIEDKKIIIQYEVTPEFSKEILLSECSKGFLLPIKASKYLGCDCIYKINNEVVTMVTE